MVSAELRRKSKRDRPAPPDPSTLRRATRADLVADLEFRDQEIAVFIGGEWVAWTIHARDVPWSEQSRTSEKHTTVQVFGRTERRSTDTTAVVQEILHAAVKPEKCNPPLSAEDLDNLDGPIFTALTAHLGLDEAESQEEAEEAGESGAS